MSSITGLLIAINAIAFGWLGLTGGWDSNASLVAHGAIVPVYVRLYGQWWRIVSGAFLHAGIVHIGMNMLALWQLGTILESMLGSLAMLWIYLASMLGAGLCVVAFGANEATVGASGAIYGLFGALIAIGLRLGPSGRSIVASTVPVLVINIAFTFMIPNISISSHFGGLLTGFILALGLNIRRSNESSRLLP